MHRHLKHFGYGMELMAPISHGLRTYHPSSSLTFCFNCPPAVFLSMLQTN